jgi:hypothetical protein
MTEAKDRADVLDREALEHVHGIVDSFRWRRGQAGRVDQAEA